MKKAKRITKREIDIDNNMLRAFENIKNLHDAIASILERLGGMERKLASAANVNDIRRMDRSFGILEERLHKLNETVNAHEGHIADLRIVTGDVEPEKPKAKTWADVMCKELEGKFSPSPALFGYINELVLAAQRKALAEASKLVSKNEPGFRTLPEAGRAIEAIANDRLGP